MAVYSFDPDTGGFWLENGTVKLLIKPDATIVNTLLALAREVGYFRFRLDVTTEDGLSDSFYLDAIGPFLITPMKLGPAGDGTYKGDASITGGLNAEMSAVTNYIDISTSHIDINGVIHEISIRISLTDGANSAVISFQDATSTGIKRMVLSAEANLYPQGYGLQGAGGSMKAGGNGTYTAPLPYDDSTYYFYNKGLIKKDAVTLETVSAIDDYAVCYSADASIGLFSRYVNLFYASVRSLSAGDERQFATLAFLPESVTKLKHKAELYFGTWAVGSDASCKAEYDALPYIEDLEALQLPYPYYQIVRTDMSANLEDFNKKFQDMLESFNQKVTYILGNGMIKGDGKYLGTGELGAINAPAGSVSAKLFKHRGKSSFWDATVQSLGEDYVLKSMVMAREGGKRFFVWADPLDSAWCAANPADQAVGVDEVTPEGSAIKLKRMVTPGQAYHDAFIEHVTYLCQNYNFYGLVLGATPYRDVDYSAEAKALFLTDNTLLTDWPRKADGSIDIEDETLGKWKTAKLALLWDEIKAVTVANNKKFFIMVEPNFASESRQAWEYGQYYPEAIKHCDGLWALGHYASFGLHPFYLQNLVNSLTTLKAQYPAKEYILSIGVWDQNGNGISSSRLRYGLNVLNILSWPSIGNGIELASSKFMTQAHWDALWGDKKTAARYRFKLPWITGFMNQSPAINF